MLFYLLGKQQFYSNKAPKYGNSIIKNNCILELGFTGYLFKAVIKMYILFFKSSKFMLGFFFVCLSFYFNLGFWQLKWVTFIYFLSL